MRKWILRGALAAALMLTLLPALAIARGGGGQNYSSGHSYSSGGSHSYSGGGYSGSGYSSGYRSSGRSNDFGLFWLLFNYPIPTLMVLGIGFALYVWVQKNQNPTARTQRAFEQREAELRTSVTAQDVQGWVNALTLKDPQFSLTNLYSKGHQVFGLLQQGWFDRDLEKVRPFLSDATFQRFAVQLALMRQQGIRNAICDWQVLDIQLIGLDQSEWFDTVHLRVRAQMRDTDVPAQTSDVQAIAAAKKKDPEPFVEVWSFVRKPGAQTKIGEDLFQGKCPNCGAPFKGGAANSCEFCGAVVNSGNYDWTLSEITQGVEHVRGYPTVDGLMQARETDPALNLEIVEDRASLVFWKWVEAQSRGETRSLAKLSVGPYLQQLDSELAGLKARHRRKVFLDCAVGGVITRLFRKDDGYDQVHVEVRWSARMGVGPADGAIPELPTVPQRWMFVLVRKSGAQTKVDNGMATNRCPNCSAPLTDNGAPSCEYCGTLLSSGDDWVLSAAQSYENWNANEEVRYTNVQQRESTYRGADVIIDAQERQRLLYMMAAMAASDGTVDDRERKLLKLCSDRWSVPWQSVEMALRAGPELFDRLLPRASTREAEVFMKSLVNMALVDGRIDRHERRMLESAADRLGMRDRLPEMLNGQ